ncbi:MAG: hypothetical protein J6S63_07340 [Atopobiaceae bacterium]|nr:hypothetical protein [Atopobiaceae bacterium]
MMCKRATVCKLTSMVAVLVVVLTMSHVALAENGPAPSQESNGTTRLWIRGQGDGGQDHTRGGNEEVQLRKRVEYKGAAHALPHTADRVVELSSLVMRLCDGALVVLVAAMALSKRGALEHA